jgi:hypothetical protein
MLTVYVVMNDKHKVALFLKKEDADRAAKLLAKSTGKTHGVHPSNVFESYQEFEEISEQM